MNFIKWRIKTFENENDIGAAKRVNNLPKTGFINIFEMNSKYNFRFY